MKFHRTGAAENILRVELKRIDPSLRSKPEAIMTQVEKINHTLEENGDSMQIDSSYRDNDGMHFDEGSDLHLS